MKKYLIILLFIICSNLYSNECVIEEKITSLRGGYTKYNFLCSDKNIIDVEMKDFYNLKEKQVYTYDPKKESGFNYFLFFFVCLAILGFFLEIFS